MHRSILLVTMTPPPPPHRAFAILSFSEVYSPPQGTQEETIPQPHPYNSKATHFHNFYERLPEFIERRIMDVIM